MATLKCFWLGCEGAWHIASAGHQDGSGHMQEGRGGRQGCARTSSVAVRLSACSRNISASVRRPNLAAMRRASLGRSSFFFRAVDACAHPAAFLGKFYRRPVPRDLASAQSCMLSAPMLQAANCAASNGLPEACS